jgi:hypothetical protein
MAVIDARMKTVTRLIEVEEEVYSLDLTVEELRTMMSVFRLVGGDPDTTARRHVNVVLGELAKVVPRQTFCEMSGAIKIESELKERS